MNNKPKHYNITSLHNNNIPTYHHPKPNNYKWLYMKEVNERRYEGFGCECERCQLRYNERDMKYIRLGNFKSGYVCIMCYNKKNDILM